VVGVVPPDAPDDASLRDRYRALLPYYMVPKRFVRLARIPVTANGKVDRSRLAARVEI
jgi:acyl-CoA synthetase (AMP-forming)/AMP-acid ligase II